MVLSPTGRSHRRRPWHRRVSGWLWAKRGWIAAAVAIVFILSTAYVVWAVQALPDPNQDVLAAGDVVVLDRNGHLIEDWNQAGHYHVNLHLNEMGPYAPAATLAAEDRNFYRHGALDLGSTARAVWVDLTHLGLREGGSTITQQLVKIQLLTPEKSIPRKAHEMVLAIAMEERFSKDQILTMYMNRVYFGHGAYGIGAAARTYFNKDAKNLTIAQAALLAGLMQAPNTYDPERHYDLARTRQMYVLGGMVDTHALTTEQADKAAAEDVKSELSIQPTARQSLAPHFVDYVLAQMESVFGADAIQQGGSWFTRRWTSRFSSQQTRRSRTGSGTSAGRTSTMPPWSPPIRGPARYWPGLARPTTTTTTSRASSMSCWRRGSRDRHSSPTSTRPRSRITGSRWRPRSTTRPRTSTATGPTTSTTAAWGR